MSEMEQLGDCEFKLSGASSDDICDAHQLAQEAWGDIAKDKNSGLLAMAYLWRRFGPPWSGGDDHKSLVDYTLTTNDSHVFLWIHLSGCGLFYSVGYLAHEKIKQKFHEPMTAWCERYDEWWWTTHPEFESWEDFGENQKKVSEVYWNERMDNAVITKAEAVIGQSPSRQDSRAWRSDNGVLRRVNQAIFDAMKELERPVYVRDCAFNLFGRCDDSDTPAERSKYAGHGIPKEAMDAAKQEE